MFYLVLRLYSQGSALPYHLSVRLCQEGNWREMEAWKRTKVHLPYCFLHVLVSVTPGTLLHLSCGGSF